MGFRDRFKKLANNEKRKDQGKADQKVEPPTNTNTNTNTQPSPPSNSPPSSDSVAASRDLWDEAYEALCAENPELIQKYEQIIIEHGKQKTGSIEPNLGECRLQLPTRKSFMS
jgi:hypothetical protein